MKHFEFGWKTADNYSIYAQGWAPDSEVKAVIVLIHGIGEHSGRYAHLAEFFIKHSIAVVSNDQRGHGKSDGKRGHTPKYDYFLDPIDQLFNEASNRFPDKPVFLYGHSMGGQIVLKYLIEREKKFKGVIVTAPAIQPAVRPSAFLLLQGKLTRRILPFITQGNGLILEGLSRDKKVMEAYTSDSMVHDRVSTETGMGMMDCCEMLNTYNGSVSSPLLLMHGDADKLTDYASTKAFAERVSGDLTFKTWEGFYHEIHNEEEQQDVFQFTLDWMKKHMP